MINEKKQPYVPQLISSPIRISLYSILLFVVLHTIFYSFEQLHYNFCTPCGFTGFIRSFFTNQSTICNALKVVSWNASVASSGMMSLTISIIGGVVMNSITAK